jgi:hypothetical protein
MIINEYESLQKIAYSIIRNSYYKYNQLQVKSEKDYLYKHSFYQNITDHILNFNISKNNRIEYFILNNEELVDEYSEGVIILTKVVEYLEFICGFKIRELFFPEQIIIRKDFKSTYFLLYFINLLTEKIFIKPKKSKENEFNLNFVKYLYDKILKLEQEKIVEETKNKVDYYNMYFDSKKSNLLREDYFYKEYINKLNKYK